MMKPLFATSCDDCPFAVENDISGDIKCAVFGRSVYRHIGLGTIPDFCPLSRGDALTVTLYKKPDAQNEDE